MVNLEDNNIASWDEVAEFHQLPNLEKLILSRNKITAINFQPGFPALFMLSIDKNAIDNWASINALNLYPQIKQVRVQGNPIFSEEMSGKWARELGIGRCEHVSKWNGGLIETNER